MATKTQEKRTIENLEQILANLASDEARANAVRRLVYNDADVSKSHIEKAIDVFFSMGKEQDAVYLAEQSGMPEKAIEIYVKSERLGLGYAIKIALELGWKKKARELAELALTREYEPSLSRHIIAELFESEKEWDRAAQLHLDGFNYEKAANCFIDAGNIEKAIECCVKGEDFYRAGAFSERIGKLEAAYGYYVQAKQTERAAGIAAKLGQWEKAAKHYMEVYHWPMAHQCAGKISKERQKEVFFFAIHYYLNMKDCSKEYRMSWALDFAQKYSDDYENDLIKIFSMAGDFASAGNKAERLGRIDAAFEFYEKGGNWLLAEMLAKRQGMEDKAKECRQRYIQGIELKIQRAVDEKDFYAAFKTAFESSMKDKKAEIAAKALAYYEGEGNFSQAWRFARHAGMTDKVKEYEALFPDLHSSLF